MSDWRVIESDCIEAMAAMPESSVDAIVTDPPYGIRFMGKAWDGADIEAQASRSQALDSMQPTRNRPKGGAFPQGSAASKAGWYDLSLKGNRAFQSWCEAWAVEALRVLKPGAHLVAFGGTRTFHRLACALEDSGFDVRDCLSWLFGSGFPKSLDVSKAIDKAAGAEREVVGRRTDGRYAYEFSEAASRSGGIMGEGAAQESRGAITTAATPDAERWQGWGTALKPAWEPIILARKPPIGTVAANVLEHGTGALNVDGCRIGVGDGGDREGEPTAEMRYTDEGSTNFAPTPGPRGGDARGRWPANVVLDPDGAAMLDEQTGTLTSGRLEPHHLRNGDRLGVNAYGHDSGDPVSASAGRTFGGDIGGASRFFYCAKAGRDERNAGLEGFAQGRSVDDDWVSESRKDAPGGGLPSLQQNVHPTVKPIDLMRWLCRLVTPPGGTVLDPFTGSGTTGCAAALEGFDFIGIEREAEYAAIARARIAYWWARPVQLSLEAA